MQPSKEQLEKVLGVSLRYETFSPFIPNADHAHYQRPWTNDHVKEIEHKPGFEKAKPVVGQRIDGSYWVIDHQHHLEALKRKGVDLTEHLVFASNGWQHEKQIFDSFQHWAIDGE